MNKSVTVIIVGGGGTFGLSTAWYLSKAGYTNIICMDRWPVPSPSSAGYDLNKIVRTEYGTQIYTQLAHEALALWKGEMFKGAFHETGWIFGTDGTSELGRDQNFRRAVQNTELVGDASKMVNLKDWNAALKMFPFLASNQHGSEMNEGKKGFEAIFNGNAGWVDPVKAMELIKNQCDSQGVTFLSGAQGTVTRLIHDENQARVIGLETGDGCRHLADKVILCAGAYSDTLLDFKGQLEATAYAVTHIKMTEDQFHRYKDMPVVNISRRGYLFPPQEQGRLFKVCNLDVSYLNSEDSSKRSNGWGSVSIPRDPAYHPTDTQPTLAQEVTQKFLKYVLPEFANSEVHSSRLCWDAESHDHHWIIGSHPDSPNSLFIATGGSGHSFKNIVNIGKYVCQMLEGTLDQQLRELWRWRPDRIGASEGNEERARRPKLDLNKAVGWNHDSQVAT